MTDKPRTMLLSSQEWRTLVASGATNLYSFISAMPSSIPTAADLVWLHEVVDRMNVQISAWGASGLQQAAAPVPEQPAMTDYLNQFQGNGAAESVTAAEPKKKRGWQKGRKRGPRKPKQGEAVQ